MKKNLLLTAVFIIVCMFAANAQTEKGKWLVFGSGNLSLEAGKDKVKSGGKSTVTEKFTFFNFETKAGTFIIDNLAAGLSVNFYSNTWKDPDDNDKYTYSEISAGPFARYYVTELNGLWPYAQADIGISKEKDADNLRFEYRLSGGASYFLNERVAIDASLGFKNSISSFDVEEAYYNGETRSDSSKKNKYITGAVSFELGIVVILGN